MIREAEVERNRRTLAIYEDAARHEDEAKARRRELEIVRAFLERVGGRVRKQWANQDTFVKDAEWNAFYVEALQRELQAMRHAAEKIISRHPKLAIDK
jgi:hypothetical protein